MVTLLITLAIIILIGLPAIFIISICMASARTTQREENNSVTAQGADAGFAMKSGIKGEPRKTKPKASRTPNPSLRVVER